MGNTKSSKLKELYAKNKFEELRAENDKHIGVFRVLKFPGFKDEMFVLKVLNPSLYDQYADIGEFQKKLSNPHPSICDFYFIETNAKSSDLYDMLYEFGTPFSECAAKETHLWIFVDQILEGLIFMESNGLHYPLVNKKYVVKLERKKVKLINPYCFPNFIKEVLEIYLNPNNPISKRKEYAKGQIVNNIKDFGILLCALAINCNEYQLRNDAKYASQLITSLEKKFSSNYIVLVKTILLSNKPPASFIEVKEVIQRNLSNSMKFGKRPSAKEKALPEPGAIGSKIGQGFVKVGNDFPPGNDKMNTSSSNKLHSFSISEQDSLGSNQSITSKSSMNKSGSSKGNLRIFDDEPSQTSIIKGHDGSPKRLVNNTPSQFGHVLKANDSSQSLNNTNSISILGPSTPKMKSNVTLSFKHEVMPSNLLSRSFQKQKTEVVEQVIDDNQLPLNNQKPIIDLSKSKPQAPKINNFTTPESPPPQKDNAIEQQVNQQKLDQPNPPPINNNQECKEPVPISVDKQADFVSKSPETIVPQQLINPTAQANLKQELPTVQARVIESQITRVNSEEFLPRAMPVAKPMSSENKAVIDPSSPLAKTDQKNQIENLETKVVHESPFDRIISNPDPQALKPRLSYRNISSPLKMDNPLNFNMKSTSFSNSKLERMVPIVKLPDEPQLIEPPMIPSDELHEPIDLKKETQKYPDVPFEAGLLSQTLLNDGHLPQPNRHNEFSVVNSPSHQSNLQFDPIVVNPAYLVSQNFETVSQTEQNIKNAIDGRGYELTPETLLIDQTPIEAQTKTNNENHEFIPIYQIDPENHALDDQKTTSVVSDPDQTSFVVQPTNTNFYWIPSEVQPPEPKRMVAEVNNEPDIPLIPNQFMDNPDEITVQPHSLIQSQNESLFFESFPVDQSYSKLFQGNNFLESNLGVQNPIQQPTQPMDSYVPHPTPLIPLVNHEEPQDEFHQTDIQKEFVHSPLDNQEVIQQQNYPEKIIEGPQNPTQDHFFDLNEQVPDVNEAIPPAQNPHANVEHDHFFEEPNKKELNLDHQVDHPQSVEPLLIIPRDITQECESFSSPYKIPSPAINPQPADEHDHIKQEDQFSPRSMFQSDPRSSHEDEKSAQMRNSLISDDAIVPTAKPQFEFINQPSTGISMNFYLQKHDKTAWSHPLDVSPYLSDTNPRGSFDFQDAVKIEEIPDVPKEIRDFEELPEVPSPVIPNHLEMLLENNDRTLDLFKFDSESFDLGKQALDHLNFESPQQPQLNTHIQVPIYVQPHPMEGLIPEINPVKNLQEDFEQAHQIESQHFDHQLEPFDPEHVEINDAAKLVTEEHDGQTEMKIENQQPVQEMIHKNYQEKHEQNGEPSQPQMNVEPTVAPMPVSLAQPQILQPVQTTRRIKRVIHKWIAAENRHQKIIEYDDGSVEEAVNDENDEIKKKFMINTPSNPSIPPMTTPTVTNSQPTQEKAPQEQSNNPPNTDLNAQPQHQNLQEFQPSYNQPEQQQMSAQDQQFQNSQDVSDLGKVSHMNFYNIPEQRSMSSSFMNRESQICEKLYFVLIPDGDMPPMLLFRPKILTYNPKFTLMAQVANRNHPAVPSMYHNVDNNVVREPRKSVSSNVPFIPQPVMKAQIIPEASQTRPMTSTTMLSNNAKIIRKA